MTTTTPRKGGILRPRPDDFESTYIEVGRVGCIEYYRTHRTVVERWADEVGKERIRKARADYVAECKQRTKSKVVAVQPSVAETCDPDERAAACQYLRENRNGGWRVGAREDGRYFVGTAVLTGAEVIARAVAKGMDEWYIEQDMFKRLDLGNVDEFVLDTETRTVGHKFPEFQDRRGDELKPHRDDWGGKRMSLNFDDGDENEFWGAH